MHNFFYLEPSAADGGMRIVGKDIDQVVQFETKPYLFQLGRGKYRLVTNHAKKAEKVEFETERELSDYDGSYAVETDIPLTRRIMVDEEIEIGDVPKCYFDIECKDNVRFPDPSKDPIISIGCIMDDKEYFFHGSEREILSEFTELVRNCGALISYNGGTDVWEQHGFDIPYIAQRYGLVVENRKPNKAILQLWNSEMRHCAFFDIYRIYRYEMARIGKSLAGGMGLDSVCKHELGRGKVRRNKPISEMSEKELEEYNMGDVRLLRDLDSKFKFVDMKIGLARITNSTLTAFRRNKRHLEVMPLGMVDNLILKYGHKLGYCFPDVPYGNISTADVTGALVLEPKVGLHENVQNYDVRQMYPSIMINEKVSPDQRRLLVPTILKDLRTMRQRLKARYEKTKATQDYILQYNYKVLANIFYGAYAMPYCRIYNNRFANFVTAKGQKILREIISIAENMGHAVLYGDTDSIFVKVEPDDVESLLGIINSRIAPYEVEAGEFYDSILYVGTKSGGIKKKYAGKTKGTITIKGLESVKRNYSTLARDTQITVLEKLLGGESVESCERYLNGIKKGLLAGKYDSQLIISTGVKQLESYDSTRKLPPHARALKMAMGKGCNNLIDVSYVWTKGDVVPVTGPGDLNNIDIDYNLYYSKQVRAVVDPLLRSVQIGNGTWVEPSRIMKRINVHNSSLMDFASS